METGNPPAYRSTLVVQPGRGGKYEWEIVTRSARTGDVVRVERGEDLAYDNWDAAIEAGNKAALDYRPDDPPVLRLPD
ncbi:hypothetical protein A6B37_08800 [Achromobacter sp. HZ01]|jgi:hypothetical protein|uniref:Uncharacterized protein n=1 Tax=Achromobacter pulmonis TaxID=1389932 RepID=A0A2N8KQM6_9BURK|nr:MULTISPECIES: hypothetical protein [Achromobacter]MBO9328128.1 hypothetical protein [Achromobacter xylosoxidans]PND35730.1 hypothetical protein C1I89_05055 [Achromobacter pulmonis]RAP66011.1 hypothetical protein A6B37_08800 [Achromobacter sp. HZ01]